MSTPDTSWWMTAPREGFSEHCIAVFGVNFDNAPTFISRSEFIQVKGRPHQVKKTVGVPMHQMPAQSTRQRRVSALRQQGNRKSEKAMQSASLL